MNGTQPYFILFNYIGKIVREKASVRYTIDDIYFNDFNILDILGWFFPKNMQTRGRFCKFVCYLF